MKEIKSYLVCVLVVGLIGCEPGPEPINYDVDQCQFCKMTISDPRFGAEIITAKGRVLKYDAAECMIQYLNQENPGYRQLLVTSYDQPKELFPVDSLLFVISPKYKSPMGGNIAGFRHFPSSESNSEKLIPISWEDLQKKTYLN